VNPKYSIYALWLYCSRRVCFSMHCV